MNFFKISFIHLFFALLVGFSFVACESDDDDDMVIADRDKTISEYLETAENFSILKSALDQANLTEALNNTDTEFTLFAPNNAAFVAAGVDLDDIDEDDLKAILLYHVIEGDKVKEENLLLEDRYFTTESVYGVNGAKLSMMLEKENGNLKINDNIAISDSENDFKNGIIYELGDVLALPSLNSVITNDGKLQYLETVLGGSTNLSDVFDGNDDFTLFAPINDGFEDIEETLQELSEEQIDKVLTYHVLADVVNEEGLEDDAVFTTVNGETLKVDVDLNLIRLESTDGEKTRIRINNIQTTDGIIHIIDDVLVPNNL